MLRWVLVLLVLCTTPASSAERQQVCAKSGQQAYQVQATILDGHELNTATRTLDYTAYAKYVVIFWAQGQASVIELDFPFLTPLGTNGKDQDGRTWEISTMPVCF